MYFVDATVCALVSNASIPIFEELSFANTSSMLAD
jgi:hypothetical protein